MVLSLSAQRQMYVWQDGVKTTYEVANVDSITFSKVENPDPNTGNHEYVDLGLSVKWATCNVGATKPEEYGDYFAWGETEPKSTYNWSTYKYCNGSSSTLTKYNTVSSRGTVDNKTTLDLSDDAARANWGGSWRMPTDAELTELRENCTWTWTTQNGVYGYKVTSKKNGESIFLPAAGYRYDSSLSYAGSYGYYWSSSLYTDYPYSAWNVDFYSNNVGRSNFLRSYGFSVRPVYGEYIPASTLPTVTTSSATNISKTSATVGGNVTNDGGTSVTARGVVYSTSSNPTTSNSKVTSGSGMGSFSVNLTNLVEGTTYYVRAYAINEKGTAYGAEKSFTTSSVVLPTVTTSSATNISKISATVGGNVTADGGAIVTERGVVYSTSQNPTTANSTVTSGSGIGSFTCSLTNLQEGTTYYVRAYATNEKGTAYGHQEVFTTLESPIENEYVDLGLSVKWATCNVGANSPEDYGDYFAWGETQPKSTYNWSTYKYCNGSSTSLTKYCTKSSYGTVDNKTTLELSDDAARANWGGSWRMPTDAELTELREQCTWTWTTQNGVYGYKVTSKKSGYTNKSIFLPAAGYRDDSSLYTDYPNYPKYAWYVYFISDIVFRRNNSRSCGFSVRPVCQ